MSLWPRRSSSISMKAPSSSGSGNSSTAKRMASAAWSKRRYLILLTIFRLREGNNSAGASKSNLSMPLSNDLARAECMKLMVLCGHGEAFLPGVSRGKSVYGQDAAYRRRFPAKRSKSSTFWPIQGQELRNAGAAGTGARAPERCHGSGNASSEYSEYAGNFPFRDDQAVALRRRRLSDPVAALGDPVQYAGMSQCLGGGRQAPAGAGTGHRYPAAHFR